MRLRLTPSLWAVAAAASLAASCSKRPSPGAPGAPVRSPPVPSVTCVKVFSETAYKLEIKGRIYGSTVKEIRPTRAGAGFLVLSGRGPLLVTAAHVVCAPPRPERIVDDGSKTIRIDGERTTVKSASFRVRVGDLSFQPSRILVDRDCDTALMSLGEEALALLRLSAFELALPAPEVGAKVKAWGFPGTSVPQLKEGMLVAAIEKGYFALNSSIDPGFSGGPLVDSDGKLLGMVVRSTEQQTRCIPAAAIARAAGSFETASAEYADGMSAR